VFGQNGAPGSYGDFVTNTDAFALMDYNLFKSGDKYGLFPSGSGTGSTLYTLPGSLATMQSHLVGSPVGQENHSVFAPVQYQNASGTMWRAADWKLVVGSPGSATSAPSSPGGATGPGSSNGQTTGTAVDMGPWGNGATRIGVGWLEPADLAQP
jgi:hypothetical protein